MHNHLHTHQDDDLDMLDAMNADRQSALAVRGGYFTLTRQMETEDDDQFDVDVTIMDFLAYKAINLIFEWRSSINPYVSDLPSALASMTAGMSLCRISKPNMIHCIHASSRPLVVPSLLSS